MNGVTPRTSARRWTSSLLLLVLPAMSACKFDVTNPGPVNDSRLDDPSAQLALTNGAGRALSSALAWIAYTGGVAALELQGSGNITQFGVTLKQRAGDLAPEQAEADEHWQRGQTARWVAEESVRRMQTAIGAKFASDPIAAQALVYVGFANRLLGENMCTAVIDGGAAQPRTVHLDRAKAAFTQAIDIAGRASKPDLVMAARAGRASVNAWLGDWTAAAADAAAVPKAFVYQIVYSEIEVDQYNRIFWAGASSPFRAATVWSTYFEQYYTNTGDPRTPWTKVTGQPTGDGSNIPFSKQMKYTSRTSPARLATGREMQLIQAEAQVRSGGWPAATAIMNQLRADIGLPAVTTTSAVETWNLLRRERGAELWLEGRTLGDVYRWEKEQVPGTHYQSLTGRDRCFPIGQSEIDTNPNITTEKG
jgi:hypothetical protein